MSANRCAFSRSDSDARSELVSEPKRSSKNPPATMGLTMPARMFCSAWDVHPSRTASRMAETSAKRFILENKRVVQSTAKKHKMKTRKRSCELVFSVNIKKRLFFCCSWCGKGIERGGQVNILVNNSLCSSLRRVDLAHVSFILVLKKKGGALIAFYHVVVIVLKLSPLILIKQCISKKKRTIWKHASKSLSASVCNDGTV